MDTGRPVCEVVWIKDRHRLIDAESYERTYGSDGGPEICSGYYIARWPAGTPDRHFLHPDVVFLGPYDSRRAAETAVDTMRGERLSELPPPRPGPHPSDRGRDIGWSRTVGRPRL
jgi:hypothetical protein